MEGDQLQDLFHPGKSLRLARKVKVSEFSVNLTTGDRILHGNPAMRAILMAKGILDLLESWGYKRVPVVKQLSQGSTNSKTCTVEQEDMARCLERVRRYSAPQ